MGWIHKCCETYDNNIHMAGRVDGNAVTLTPLYFIMQKAQIEITLNQSGEFKSACRVDKKDADVLIPATEKSASRAGAKSCPHPLCDQLLYIALGHPSYPDHECFAERYNSYMEQIKEWADSPYSHFIVEAVNTYCANGTVLTDLADSGIIRLDADGRLEKGKVEGADYEKCLVRWRVQKLGETDAAWLNTELFERYSNFYASKQANLHKDICYISGNEETIASGYPKGILRSAYGAKLISANDTSGFTFRGRFKEASEAISVGSINLQKAHAALSWLCSNQSAYYGGRTFVCWNPKGNNIPHFDPGEYTFADVTDNESETSFGAYTMAVYTKQLKRAIAGFEEVLDDNEDIVIMALEAATTGRLSITYYNELVASDYLNRLESWQTTCCWYMGTKRNDVAYVGDIRSPSIKDIIRYAYGAERGKFVSVDDKLLSEHSQRILHCIVDGAPMPKDFVSSIVSKASMRMSYKNDYERLLSVACALVRKYRNNIQGKKGEIWTMELDKTNADRSYLFGRMLAVAEKVERSAYDRDESREPAAVRLQAAFAAHPMRTWAILEKSLIPYYAKLNPGLRRFYKDIIGEILATLTETSSSKLNAPLEDAYLLGYYLQRREFYVKNKDNNAETKE